jgi:periplasmic protein CpxP/Spy
VKSKTVIGKLALFATLAVALVISTSYAVAEDGPAHHHGMGMRGGFMGGPGMGFPMHGLNLTDDQRAQMKQIFQNERPNIKPLMQQEFQAHQQMMTLITSGTFDEAKATALVAQESQIHQQMQIEHLKMASQMYQLLSADQKSKVAEMMAKHQQMMQQHTQNRPAPPADNQ